MAFDASPRRAKRRKTDSTPNTVDLPLGSRILRTVKQAVYGKLLKPKINGFTRSPSSFDHEELFLEQPLTEKNQGQGMDWRSDGGAKAAVDPVLPRNTTQDQSAEQRGEVEDTASRSRPGRKRKSSGRGRTTGKGNTKQQGDEQPEQLLPKEKLKKHKGWAWVTEEDELGGDAGGTQRLELGLYTSDVATDGAGGRGIDPMLEGEEISHEDQTTGTKINNDHIVENDLPVASTKNLRRRSTKDPFRPAPTTVADSMFRTTSGRRKKQKKEEQIIAPERQDEAEEGSGLEQMIVRDASVDDLARPQQIAAAEELGGKTANEPTLGKKRTRRPAAEVDEESPFNTAAARIDQRVSLPSERLQEASEYTERLRALLERSPELPSTLQTHILEGLTGKRRLRLVNLDDEYQKVHQLVEQTVLAGEGNSMLIIGSRGTGKSTLVETAISELASANKDDFHVVRLNGYIHTDDKLALREIWRQLGREMEVDDEVLGGRSNYADTLTSLLALLSHEAEGLETEEGHIAKSVVFVLDEFDLFASHPRQTLLYNLFDVSQSRNAPIAVLGLTTKVNIVDSLEKRVKSRFGQRYVHLSLPKSFQAFKDICLSALFYHPPTSSDLSMRLHQDKEKQKALEDLSTIWNVYTHHLINTPPFQQHLQTIYSTTKSIPTVLSSLLLPTLSLTPSTLFSPIGLPTLFPPPSNLSLLSTLSPLHLALLIAAARLDILLDTDLCSFPLVYDEYSTLASRQKSSAAAAGQLATGAGARVWSKEITKGAWEGLAERGLIIQAGKEGVWRVDVGLEEVGAWIEGEGKGMGMGSMGKWCREL